MKILELPQSALQVLETAAETFSEKPLTNELLYRLTLPDVRQTLAAAQLNAGEAGDQVPAGVYAAIFVLKHGEPLVTLPVDDGTQLLTNIETGGATKGSDA